jgi:hypothetical protein
MGSGRRRHDLAGRQHRPRHRARCRTDAQPAHPGIIPDWFPPPHSGLTDRAGPPTQLGEGDSGCRLRAARQVCRRTSHRFPRSRWRASWQRRTEARAGVADEHVG